MIITFLLGFSVPLIARRLIKIFPEDAGTAFAYLLTPRRIKIYKSSERSKQRAKLFFKLLGLCGFYGIVFLIGIPFFIDSSYWILAFIWILCVLLEIDKRSMLLPDVLTVPLLIIGFAYACLADGNITPVQSSVGAMFGYFVPVISSGLVSFFKKDTIGGGDIKIIAALGAWLGIYYLSLAILISFFIFLAVAICKKNRTGPYGPAIVIASVISMYCMQTNLLIPFIIN